jgi:type I restriction enzyme M protein
MSCHLYNVAKMTVIPAKAGIKKRRSSREYVSSKNHNTLSEEHLTKIMATYKSREEVEKNAHVAGFDEIKENDFNLNIPRYVDTFEEEEEIDIDAVQIEIYELEKELIEVRVKMAEKLKQLKIDNG